MWASDESNEKTGKYVKLQFTAAVISLLNYIETVLDSMLLLESEKDTMYWAFDTRELTRGSLAERCQAYHEALTDHWMQVDEVRKAEDLDPTGFNWMQLGLGSVLLNPDTMEVFTPNTGQTSQLGDQTVEPRANDRHDPKTGQFAPKNSGGGVDKSEKDAIIEHKKEIIADFKSTNFNGEIHIPPTEIDINTLSYDNKHIKNRGHDTNEKKAKQYIKDAKISYTKSVNGEKFENYIGDKGATYVDVSKGLIRTSFSSAEYNKGTKNILRTVNKYANKKE